MQFFIFWILDICKDMLLGIFLADFVDFET